MNKTLQSFSKLLFLSLLSFITLSSEIQAQIDLELNLSQTIENPGAWKNYSVVATIQNTGSATASNIKVNFPKIAGVVYQGGNEYSATAGKFYPYSNQNWVLSSLAPNAQATLTINYFTIASGAGASYGQVMQASPNDVDSTPGNGTPPSVNEDDESLSIGGGGPQPGSPDLKLADIQIANSGLQGSVVNYTLDLRNTGDAIAAGDYQIKVFLSPTPGTGGGTTQVGVINTGNTPVGTIQDVQGAITIPANYAEGSAYLVFFVDATNAIEESNENNNKISRAFTVNADGGPGGDFCAFENTYFPLTPTTNPNFNNPVNFYGGESANGFKFKVADGFGPVIYTDLTLDPDGNAISINPNGQAPSTAQTLASGATFTSSNNGNNSFKVTITSASGSTLLNKTYSNVTSDATADISAGVIERPGGYYFYYSWRSQSNGIVRLFVMTVNSSGAEQNYFETSYEFDTQNFFAVDVDASGNLYLTRDNVSIRTVYLVKVNPSGVIYDEVITGDLVSNELNQATYLASENAVYLLLFLDPWTRVRKVNASDGSTIWETNLVDVFNPSSSIIKVRNKTPKMLVKNDGSTTIAYRYQNPIGPDGAEMGQLDKNGNTIWWRALDADDHYTVAGYTSDGGFLFAGKKGDDFAVLKVNSQGESTPLCDEGPPTGGGDIDLSLSINANGTPDIWTNYSTTLTVRNDGPETATGVQVQLYKASGLVLKGGNEYSSTQGTFTAYGNNVWNVGQLAAGASASLQVNYFITSNGPFEFYAQVINANEEDGDSTPNNGIIGVENEDDEAVLNTSGLGGQTRLAQPTDQGRPFLLRSVFPNPAIYGQVNIVMSSLEEAQTEIYLFNAQGKLVRSEAVSATKGTNQFTLDINQLSSGMYFVQIAGTNSKGATARFFVEKE